VLPNQKTEVLGKLKKLAISLTPRFSEVETSPHGSRENRFNGFRFGKPLKRLRTFSD
jgi:hypothetical protein